ncbi:MAG: VanZ family protein [Akkermansiaceae bacterium]
MRIWGLELEIAFFLFAITYPLFLAPLVYGNYRRHGCFSGWPALVTTGFFLYLCGLIAFTFFPLPTITPDFCARHEALRHWQLVPFRFLGDIRELIAAEGILHTLLSHTVLVQLFNIVLTVPLGFIIAYRFQKGIRTAFVIGLATSLLIEITQGTGIFGLYPCPYRLAEVDDLATLPVYGPLRVRSSSGLHCLRSRALQGTTRIPISTSAIDLGKVFIFRSKNLLTARMIRYQRISNKPPLFRCLTPRKPFPFP